MIVQQYAIIVLFTKCADKILSFFQLYIDPNDPEVNWVFLLISAFCYIHAVFEIFSDC